MQMTGRPPAPLLQPHTTPAAPALGDLPRDRPEPPTASRQLASSALRLPGRAAAKTALQCAALALFVLVYCPTRAAATPPLPASADSLIHTNLLRTIDLSTGSNVRETISIAVENVGKQAVSEYHLAVPLVHARNLAHFSCKEKNSRQNMDMQQDTVAEKRQLQYYKITLAPPLKPAQSRTITMRLTFVGLLDPLPAEVDQLGRQSLIYKGNLYFISPYSSKMHKTLLKLPSDIIYSAPETPLPISQSKSTVTYGPYENVTAFTEEPLIVHFESVKGAVATKSLLRELEISHWGGNAAIEEQYHFVHQGARLKGNFRRVDFQLHTHVQHLSSVVNTLALVLPLSARDPYYRDEIGNVSRSNFRLEAARGRSLLQLRPRYPLYGGWNYTCYLGYNMPLSEIVRVHQADGQGKGQYILRAPFVHTFEDMDTWYESVEVKIVLPEGARNIDYYVPFPIAGSEMSVTRTYLDTIGRPTLHLFVNMLVPEDGKLSFEVTYDLPAVELLRKPFTVAAAFMVIFGVWILFSRVETRIVPVKP